jgi:hypothetical protein
LCKRLTNPGEDGLAVEFQGCLVLVNRTGRSVGT